MTEDEKEMIMNFGRLEYDHDRMSLLLGRDISEEFRDKKSEYCKLYDYGRAISQYKIDLKLNEMAMSGDLKAIEKIEQNRRIKEAKKKS